MGAGRFAFSWVLIWVFILGSQPFQSIQAEVERDLINYPPPFFSILRLTQLKGPVLKCCPTRKRVSDTWQGYNAWMGKRPHLLQAISLMPAVWRLRWKGLGSERCAETLASAKWRCWHNWGGGRDHFALQSAHFYLGTDYVFFVLATSLFSSFCVCTNSVRQKV